MNRTSAPSGRLSPLFTWRSVLASEDGPKDFELAVVREGEQTTTTVKGSTQRHVGLTLSLHMNERGGSCYPGVPLIVEETSLGERAVQRALLALAKSGWLLVEKSASELGTNVYTATIPGGVPGTPAYRDPLEGVPGTPKDVTKDVYVLPSEGLRSIIDAWKSNAPPLIPHRDSFYETGKTATAIRAALKVYPAEVVVEAIELHAKVLGDDGYRWDYRWTLIEFLKRGLDRFVPEAEPLRNFRAAGQAKPTAEDLRGLDDI